MSFLTPLYMLGLAAVVAPIVFHLIRRAPKGAVEIEVTVAPDASQVLVHGP